jgi:hypothetical protein
MPVPDMDAHGVRMARSSAMRDHGNDQTLKVPSIRDTAYEQEHEIEG